jgi:hypothetical protein
MCAVRSIGAPDFGDKLSKALPKHGMRLVLSYPHSDRSYLYVTHPASHFVDPVHDDSLFASRYGALKNGLLITDFMR